VETWGGSKTEDVLNRLFKGTEVIAKEKLQFYLRLGGTRPFTAKNLTQSCDTAMSRTKRTPKVAGREMKPSDSASLFF